MQVKQRRAHIEDVRKDDQRDARGARLKDRGLVVGGERQGQQPDERGEKHEHRDIVVLEIALHQIFVEMRGDGPEHRPENAKKSQAMS